MNIENLSNKYNLNETEKTILLFIEKHTEDIKSVGIRGVAKHCYTSPATIVNLAKKMNFSGYSELVFKLKENKLIDNEIILSETTNTLYYEKLAQGYFTEFKQVMDDYRDKNIMILGSGYSQIIANYINESFVLNGFRSISNSHLELIQKEFAKETLLIVVTESGETSRLKELIKQATENDIEVLSFLGNEHSTISNYSRLAIATHNDVQFSNNPHEPHLFYGSVLLLFEILLSKYLRSIISW